MEEEIIPLMNSLQDVFNKVNVDADLKQKMELPQIVVVGAQSAGKSSVLESLVGGSFLPRGTGTVTRCPLVMQLIRTPIDDKINRNEEDGTLEVLEFCKFLHTSDQIFTDFDKVRQEIEDETNSKAGSNKGITRDAITLKVYSPNVANLTVVDLPGIVKVPSGDQPWDIESQVCKMILDYIRNPKSIILAVFAANNDMATAESLKLAKDVDPEGKRTLGVITKLDLMDAGTDATDMLTGKVIPVQLGIIGVVNRSQKDINENKAVKDALLYEEEYLQTNYPALALKNGSKYLAKTLSILLRDHIRECLPDLKRRVEDKIEEVDGVLTSFGEEVRDTYREYVELVRKFEKSYLANLTGIPTDIIESKELVGAARVNHIFQNNFKLDISKVNSSLEVRPEELVIKIQNARGFRPAFGIPEEIFEKLIEKLIGRLSRPCLKCVDNVREEMERNITRCEGETSHDVAKKRFPKFYNYAHITVMGMITRAVDETKKRVQSLIDCQAAFINISSMIVEMHKILYPENKSEEKETKEGQTSKRNGKTPRATTAIQRRTAQFYNDDDEDEVDEEEKLESKIDQATKDLGDCRKLQKLIVTYFEEVRKAMIDMVPKTIMYYLVKRVNNHLMSKLLADSRDPALVDKLMAESEDITDRRKFTIQQKETLEQANEIMSQISSGI